MSNSDNSLHQSDSESRPTLSRSSAIPIILILVLIAGAFFRLQSLGDHPLWADEYLMFASAKQPFSELIKKKFYIDETVVESPDPPLAILISGFFVKDMDDYKEDPTVRMFFRLAPAVAGILSIIALFYLGSLVLGRRIALFASILIAFSYHAVYYSREARPYSFFVLISIGAAMTFYKVYKKPSVMNLSLFSLCMICALYTHYFSCFLVFVICFWTVAFTYLTYKKRGIYAARDFALRTFASLVAIALAYLPWVPALLRAIDQGGRGVPEDIDIYDNLLLGNFAPWYYYKLVSVWSTGNFLPWIAFALTIAGLVWMIRKKPEAALLIIPWLILPWLVLPFIKGSVLTNYRYLIFGMPAFFLILAASLEAIFNGILKIGQTPTNKKLSLLFILILLAFLLFPNLRAIRKGSQVKCFNTCSEYSCIEYIDRCGEHQWGRP